MKRSVLFAFFLVQFSAVALGDTLGSDARPVSGIDAVLARDGGENVSGGINCRIEPGRPLCNDLRRFDLLLQDCTGATCYEVWDKQIELIERIDGYYYEAVSFGAPVADDLEKLAKRTAVKLCSVKISGPATYISKLVVAYNQLVGILLELQELGENPVPYSCTFQVTP